MGREQLLEVGGLSTICGCPRSAIVILGSTIA